MQLELAFKDGRLVSARADLTWARPPRGVSTELLLYVKEKREEKKKSQAF